MLDKVSRIYRVTMEKNAHEQKRHEEEKKNPGQFEDMLEEAEAGLVEKELQNVVDRA